MTQSEALELIRRALEAAIKDKKEITAETDLVEEEILDSLDGMVFLLELEKVSGIKFPQDGDLVEEGYYKVPKLVSLLTAGG